MTGHWAGRALVEAEIPFPAVAQTVRFGLGRSKMLCLSMGIDRLPLRRWTVRLCIRSFKAMARQLATFRRKIGLFRIDMPRVAIWSAF